MMMPQHLLSLLCEIEDRKVSMRIPNTRIVFSFFSRVVRTWIIEFSTGTSLRHVVEDHHRSSWGLNSAWKLQLSTVQCTWYLVRNKRTRYVPGTYVAQSWRAHFIGWMDCFFFLNGWMGAPNYTSLFIGLLLCYK